MEYKTVTHCRACLGVDLHEFLHLPPLPIGDQFLPQKGFSRTVIEQSCLVCPKCSLVTLKNTVDPSVLYENYIYQSNLSVGLSEHFLAYARSMCQCLRLQAGAQMVDIGSNDGSLLRAFKELNINVLGFEPSKEIAAQAQKSGLHTINSLFEKKSIPPGLTADLVTANNVFANIEDVDSVVQAVYSILNNNGVFVIETGYQVDLIQNLILDNIYHEHISYFSVKSLVALFSRLDMEIFNIERIATKGGSIRCYIQKKGAQHHVNSSVGHLLNFENELGFDSLQAHILFNERFLTLKDKVSLSVSALSKRKLSIDAFGASVGSVTMIEYFGLHEHIGVIYDDHPLKFNTYSPYRNIRTLSSEKLLGNNPDMVLMLAWRYRYLITQKHHNYLDRGGKFLSILPGLYEFK